MQTPLQIVFENDDLIAINKPHGLLVHRSKIAKDASAFALQQVRNHIGQRVYPVHRLDRKTSGVLLFAKNKHANSEVQKLFAQRDVRKIYHAIVRGHTKGTYTINYHLQDGNSLKEAITHFKTLQKFEIDLPSQNFPTSRYSFIEIVPETGRFHQIRKHMAHIFHPILGDRPHGCNKQNRLWKEHFSMTTMMLHAKSLMFQFNDECIMIEADYSTEFNRVMDIIKVKRAVSNTSAK